MFIRDHPRHGRLPNFVRRHLLHQRAQPIDLASELRAFDGKQTDCLEDLSTRLQPTTAVLRHLVAIGVHEEPRLQTAATWLLKRYQESGVSLPKSRSVELLPLLDPETYWEARLHVLQMLPGLTIPASEAETLRQVLKRNLQDDNKLVRAWTYNGLAHLADQFPRYRPEVTKLLRQAEDEPAASVRARIRNIVKAISWARP